VYCYFARWRDDGTDQAIHDLLRWRGGWGPGVHDGQGRRQTGAARRRGLAVCTALVDQGFKNAVAAHGATLGIEVKTVERNPADKGFVPQPKRWVVQQAYGTLALHPAWRGT
jgi:hypothetical protein